MNLKKSVAFLLVIAFFAALIVIAIPHVRALGATYYVSTLGNDVNAGTQASPWRHIQYAVSNVIVVAGDTIIVAAGTYDENVAIGKSLTLQSASKWGAIIQPSTVASNAIYISADGVTVDGFEIDGTTVCNNGILGWETNGLIIKNNKIHGAVNAWDGCGILLFSWGSSGTVYNNYIEGNEVYDTGRMGIMVMDYGGGKYTVTSDNTITGNTVYDVWKVAWGDGGGGIQINVGKNCAITNNLVYNVQNGQRGIYMFGSAAGNTITCNTVRDNPIGIQLWISGEQTTPYINWGGETPTSPQVRCNNISGNSLYGAKSTNILGTPMVMDAINNWWGAASGPTHASNPTGTGDKVSDNVNFSPWLRWPACTPIPVGGEWVPINKFELLAPWIGYASVISVAAASLVYVNRRKKQQN